jgi:hypothetical protein
VIDPLATLEAAAVNQPMTSDPNEWVRIEPPSTARPGVLDAVRWRTLNKLLSMTTRCPADEIIVRFCKSEKIPRWRVEAELATYRHFGPDTWQ